MLPSVLSQQIIQGLEDFLLTGFAPSTAHFQGVLKRFLETPDNLYKGPYLSVQLPFRQSGTQADFFPNIPLPFTPHWHQQLAFDRLKSTRGLSTLVATGTGSGKTECFLYPILDHCLRHQGQKGIKAILIYPMNALATDQAKRLAGIIWSNPNLKNRVTAGLFIGQSEQSPHKAMGESNLITDKDTLRESPPDILLTNYKMLDYLLMRPRDQALWRCNGPGVLHYLVVDELHTFDGAQGTDLACLIRRLKARLASPQGRLICVGTSATIGHDDAREALVQYARQVFNEPFAEDSVIGETRQGVDEFLGNCLIKYQLLPTDELAEVVDPERYDTVEAYLRAQYRLFFQEEIEGPFEDNVWRVRLGEQLKQHAMFINLLRVLERQPASLGDIVSRLKDALPVRFEQTILHLVNSLCALISTARVWTGAGTHKKSPPWQGGDLEGASGRRLDDLLPPPSLPLAKGEERGILPLAKGEERDVQPFLQVRLQLWVRELRRMVAAVSREPDEINLQFADDIKEDEGRKFLPLVQCRECHATAWGAVKPAEQSEINPDLRTFYNHFFGQHSDVLLLFPVSNEHPARLCGDCGHYHLRRGEDGRCPACDSHNVVEVFVPDRRREVQRNGARAVITSKDCPFCSARDGLIVFGARATSLISVAIGQSYATPFNDDKKLIAFSDSVQDAAHRAGFFAARTWQSNIRTAIARAIDAVSELSLDELARHTIAYWSDADINPAAFDRPRFVAEFVAPNMAWYQDYAALKESGRLPPHSRLFEDVCKRLEWEVLAEFGYRSQIGRTLERTQTAAVGLDRDALDRAARQAAARLREQIGQLRDLGDGKMRQFIAGLLMHLKNRGAIYHRFLQGYIENGGNPYVLNRQSYLPAFGPGSSLPIFLSGNGIRGQFDRLVSGQGRRPTWYQLWCDKVLGDVDLLAVSAYAGDIYRTVLAQLVEAGLLMALEARGERVWALSPRMLSVTTDVAVVACESVGTHLTVAARDLDLWIGMPCLDAQGLDHYSAAAPRRSYFSRLYRRGEIHRVVAEEHTGLLSRERREQVEKEFIEGRHAWDPNLLSATPTLEMGINIGDLSSVLLCSVPPAQANYLQRIGRAGRRDGNALSLTVASGHPHDLYFYATPQQMMRGRVEAPGVFLNASAVLERQFTAFCLDAWVASGIREGAIPLRIKPVIDHVQAARLDAFPYTFLDYVKTHGLELLERFKELFSADLSEDSIQYLERFLIGEEGMGLEWRIVHRLLELGKERQSLLSSIQALKRRIETLRARPADEATLQELGEVQMERSGLQSLLRRLNGRETLNYFTDEGLIPNYAFPEAGVTLKSVIYRRRENAEDGERRYENIVFEYERPGVAAIGELAPESHFYAGGRKVRIDQVDMQLSPIEYWRFCPSCSYTARVDTGDHYVTCPRCADPMWHDAGQRRPMLRLRQVLANTPDHKSRIVDDKDEREPVFYTRQMLADFDPANIQAAYSIMAPELPFGFEFIARATFREMNFGEFAGTVAASRIAGVELPRKGFQLCRHCGKVQPNQRGPQHTFTCPARDRQQDSDLIDCLYLYREFTSEAIRILLPITTLQGSEKQLLSFVAALQLGLKRKFGGKVDHLRVMHYDEPVASGGRKRYLMLYDTVPGGTGYLKELLRGGDHLFEVFRRALETLTRCACNNDMDKDGCYSCIYAYRESSRLSAISRDRAVDLLSRIVNHERDLQRVENLTAIGINPLFDSELEARFVEALRRYKGAGISTRLSLQVINGKPGYFLKVADRSYYLEPQVDIAGKDGVAVASRPDFLIRSARESDGFKPVAVFTDGFEFHKDRVGEDTLKRLALVQSGQYLQWSLSWNDIEAQFTGLPGQYLDLFAEGAYPGNNANSRNIRALQSQLISRLQLQHLANLHRLPSFDLLIRYLARPESEAWRAAAFIQGLSWFDQSRMLDAALRARFQEGPLQGLPTEVNQLYQVMSGQVALGGFGAWLDEQERPVSLYCALPAQAIPSMDSRQMLVAIRLHDQVDTATDAFRLAWNGFLRLYNLLQFLPLACWVTDKGLGQGLYEAVPWRQTPGQAQAPFSVDEAIASLLEEADERVHSLLKQVAKRELELPVVGYELTGPEGEIIGEAELAWEAGQVAVLFDVQKDSLAAFQHSGWRVFLVAEAEEMDMNEIIETLEVLAA